MPDTPPTDWQQLRAGLLRYLQQRVADRATAEDLVQHTLTRALERWDELRDETRLAGWLQRIAHNALVDHYRRARPGEPLPETLAAESEPQSDVARRELAECLAPMIEQLPEHYREALRWSELEGLTQQTVAERAGISLPGAKSRVQRGRGLLRQRLEACCTLEFDRDGRLDDYRPNRPGRADGGCDC